MVGGWWADLVRLEFFGRDARWLVSPVVARFGSQQPMRLEGARVRPGCVHATRSANHDFTVPEELQLAWLPSPVIIFVGTSWKRGQQSLFLLLSYSLRTLVFCLSEFSTLLCLHRFFLSKRYSSSSPRCRCRTQRTHCPSWASSPRSRRPLSESRTLCPRTNSCCWGSRHF